MSRSRFDDDLAYGDLPQRWDRQRFERFGRAPPGRHEDTFRYVESDSPRRRDVAVMEREKSRGPGGRFEERDRFFEEDRVRGPRRRTDKELFGEMDPREIADMALQPYRRRSLTREELDIDQRGSRPTLLRRQSSLDTFDRRPMRREERGEYRIAPYTPVPLPYRRDGRDDYEDVREIEIQRERSFRRRRPPKSEAGRSVREEIKAVSRHESDSTSSESFHEEDEKISVHGSRAKSSIAPSRKSRSRAPSTRAPKSVAGRSVREEVKDISIHESDSSESVSIHEEDEKISIHGSRAPRSIAPSHRSRTIRASSTRAPTVREEFHEVDIKEKIRAPSTRAPTVREEFHEIDYKESIRAPSTHVPTVRAVSVRAPSVREEIRETEIEEVIRAPTIRAQSTRPPTVREEFHETEFKEVIRSPSIHESAFQESIREERRFKKGKTKMPKRLVRIEAIMDLGYPFDEEEDFYMLNIALEKEQIDEVIAISEKYKTTGDGKKIYRFEERIEETAGLPPPPMGEHEVVERTEWINPPTVIGSRHSRSRSRRPSPSAKSSISQRNRSRRPSSPATFVEERKTIIEERRSPGPPTILRAPSAPPAPEIFEEHKTIIEERVPSHSHHGTIVLSERDRHTDRDINAEIRALEAERRALRYEREADEKRDLALRIREQRPEEELQLVEFRDRPRREILELVERDHSPTRNVIRVEKDRKERRERRKSKIIGAALATLT